jgi:predicted transcriptional regulator
MHSVGLFIKDGRRAICIPSVSGILARPGLDLACVVARSGAVASERCCGYTFGMKTAVSIPDDLFRRADELAAQLGKSRSEIYREALADYVARRDAATITRRLNEVADELVSDQAAFRQQAAHDVLERSEW